MAQSPANVRHAGVVDIGPSLDKIRGKKSTSVTGLDLTSRYELTTPPVHSRHHRNGITAPTRSERRFLVSLRMTSCGSGWIKRHFSLFKPGGRCFQQPNNSSGSFHSVMVSLSNEQRQPARHTCDRERASTSVYLPIGDEFDVFGGTESSHSSAQTVINIEIDHGSSENDLTLEEVIVWQCAAGISQLPSDDHALGGSDSSSIVAPTVWSVDQGTIASSVMAYESEGRNSDEVQFGRTTKRIGNSIADMSDDTDTPSFSLERGRKC